MFNCIVPDLTFPKMAYGTHAEPWNLRELLYRGGAGTHRRNVTELIKQGQLGPLHEERLPLVQKLHEVLTGKLERGVAQSAIHSQLCSLYRCFAWADEQGAPLTLDCIVSTFKEWTESLLHRVRILKNISQTTIYREAGNVAEAIARAIDISQGSPGRSLMRQTRIRNKKAKKRVLGTQADKQNLADAFKFGHFLTDLCDDLGAAAVRGPLPLVVKLRDGRSLPLVNGIKCSIDPTTIRDNTSRRRALRVRDALEHGAPAIDTRKSLLNLRIEAEALIFIAQAGMNLSQVAQLRRENYRWQTNGEDLLAFRVYKGRRSGEAIFRCYKAYRPHLQRYFTWLDTIGLSTTDDRIFPFLYNGMIPAAYQPSRFSATETHCAMLGIRWVGPRELRRTRINWLLRRSRNPELTAEQSAHSKQTLLAIYEQPHHQSASVEISKFHAATDPTIASPGPGRCAAVGGNPEFVANCPEEAPRPDCINPDGCIFCVYHRDVMTADYCWKLASHARMKALEVTLHKPSKLQPIHPGNRVIDRIQEKLQAIADGSAVRAQWVRDARDAVRAGRHHPTWDGHIQLFEVLG